LQEIIVLQVTLLAPVHQVVKHVKIVNIASIVHKEAIAVEFVNK
jgi:hypothetical protein